MEKTELTAETTPEKKLWVAPVAEFQEVADVTRTTAGTGGDAFGCAS